MKAGAFKSVFETPELPGLGPEKRDGILSAQEVEQRVLASGAGFSEDKLELIKALGLLWHDHLDPAHEIVQDIPSSDGSFLHGIMHRREPDYGNAKYWFRRVGTHPSFVPLGAAARELLASKNESDLMSSLLPNGTWSSFGFVDACERARSTGKRIPLLQEVQRLEFESFLGELIERA